jgi:pSer/pThr/pTyr-binding forkhead associated (FHA) protein
MTAIAHIIVQLVHIEGPRKGEIQELSEPEILIGRHPGCQVRFPKDAVTLSRKHARILREGNRFKIVDQSTNGTFVNGKQVQEIFLKDGDVITFSEGGPKVSFLTQVSDPPVPQAAAQMDTPPIFTPGISTSAPQQPVPQPQPAVPPAQPSMAPQPVPEAPPAEAAPIIEAANAPFAIQYGPALKSFQTLPITVGKGSRCDFVVNHPAMNDQQAQFFFARNQYWIKDLTGAGNVTLNGIPVQTQAPLETNMQVALSSQGPRFRFLGGGRLAEIEDPLPDQSPPPLPEPARAQPEVKPAAPRPKPGGSLFKKFFR